MANAFIGTSGWDYPGWRHGFYGGVPHRLWLARYAERLCAVEVNATFYGSQRHSTFERWCAETPPDFRFAIKGSRYLTHRRRLNEPQEAIAREREHAEALGGKLAAVLWQLPPNLGHKPNRLQRFAAALAELWPETRHTIEFRNPEWFRERTAECLSEYRIAVCLSDAADWPLWDRVTTDLVYVRLHGHARTYASAYPDTVLAEWAGRVRGWLGEGRTVHVYFDNDAEGAAPANALRLWGLIKPSPSRL